MRYLGLILITIGLVLLVYVGINFVKDKNRVKSPIPEDNGVKVIFVTPTK